VGRFPVHLVSGPEHSTRAALAFLVARTARPEKLVELAAWAETTLTY
jgi:hypothetical protein